MVKILLFLVSFTAFASGSKAPSPKESDEQYVVRGLYAKKQEKKQWCTTSVSQTLLSQYGEVVEQCEIASRFHGDNCCTQMTMKCLKPMNVEGIAKLYGYKAVVDHTPSFNEAFNLIKAGIPFSIYHHQYTMPGDGGEIIDTPHAVTAYWAFVSNGKKYIIVFDPYTGTKKTWDASYVTGNLSWYRFVYIR